jgi:hypothetical protein
MMFFLASAAKLLVIAGAFFIVSLVTRNGIIFFIQGLSIVYLAMAGAGVKQLFKGRSHGT